MPSQKSVLKSYSKALIETQGSHTKSKALISLNPRSQTPPPSTLKPKAQKHPRSQPEAQIPKIEFLRHHAIAHHQIENSRFFQACIDSCQAFARSELREMFCPGLSAIAAVECRSWGHSKNHANQPASNGSYADLHLHWRCWRGGEDRIDWDEQALPCCPA